MADFPLAFHYRVELLFGGQADEVDMRFSEVSGLSAELGTEEVNEGGENRFSHRLPAKAKYSNLVLKRGMSSGTQLTEWVQDAIYNFNFEPVDAVVSVLNNEHEPMASWSFKQCYPVKWQVSDLKSTGNEIVIETFELAYQYFTKVS